MCITTGGVDGVLTKKRHDNRRTTKLFMVKGKENVKISPVELTSSSLADGDVFILATVDKIYCWCGAKSSDIERQRGREIAGNDRYDIIIVMF